MNDHAVLDAIRTHQDATRQVFETVLAHPELGHEEYATAAYLCDRLGDAGLEVEPGVAGMPTAFRARLSSGRTGRTVGLVMLYDAVPSLTADGGIVPVHSCGHPAIAAGVWAAARALAAIREVLGGDVVVIGCPADEIHAPKTRELGGGKTLTAERGVWDDIDAALYVHPEFINTVSTRSLWMRRDRLRVSGVRSLRPGNSQAALDALSELTAAVREHDPSRLVLEHLELDGDVEESTGLILGAEVLFFGHDEAELTSTSDAVRARIRGGTWSETPTVHGIRPDDTITAAVADAFRRLGKDFVADPPPLPFATDFGEISRRVPSALIGVGRPGGWSFHTAEGAREFASADAMDCALDIARVLALTVVRLTRA